MKEVRFWINDKEYDEAIQILGDKSKLYGFAKQAFMERMKIVKSNKK